MAKDKEKVDVEQEVKTQSQSTGVTESTESLQMQLLQAKLAHLESKMAKPQSSDEAFAERVAKYESSAPERAAQKVERDARKQEIWAENQKLRYDEVCLIEAWEYRAGMLEKTNPNFADELKTMIRIKHKEAKTDLSRG